MVSRGTPPAHERNHAEGQDAEESKDQHVYRAYAPAGRTSVHFCTDVQAGIRHALVMTSACPLCHTPSPTITDAELVSGSSWQCARCGHQWDAVRLARAEAYFLYDANRSAALAGRKTP